MSNHNFHFIITTEPSLINQKNNKSPVIEVPFPPSIDLEKIITRKKNKISTKPPNAFFIYRMQYIKELHNRNYYLSMRIISPAVANSWRKEPYHVIKYYEEIARETNEIFKKKFPRLPTFQKKPVLHFQQKTNIDISNSPYLTTYQCYPNFLQPIAIKETAEYLNPRKSYRKGIHENDKKFDIENFISTFYKYKNVIKFIKDNEKELENFTLATMAQDGVIFWETIHAEFMISNHNELDDYLRDKLQQMKLMREGFKNRIKHLNYDNVNSYIINRESYRSLLLKDQVFNKEKFVSVYYPYCDIMERFIKTDIETLVLLIDHYKNFDGICFIEKELNTK
ncbi:45804_t:CDS:2 [Gigaspora margarita]|uniref:45804_t:CDS:1 n=1 Tax=Gigaspora margarita TaxID=4874 RepID=A0ABN7URZ1_GIGMA|nr:45804_t:CDS:2 [Gigaspora margarita]